MEVSDKDIYSYIVNLAEDRDVINMLSVNRKFSDDSYFKKILENRYPTLLQYKEEKQTYKHFYLEMVKYLAKLWEKYEIPYISARYFDPKQLYTRYRYPDIYRLALFEAVEVGDIKLAKHFIEKKGAQVTEFIYEAVGVKSSIEMLNFLLKNYPPPYEWLQSVLRVAKDNDNPIIIDFLTKAGIKE